MTKKRKIVLGVAGGCLVLPVLALAVVSYLASSMVYMRWDYPARDYDPLLTPKAARALPLIKAIDRYRGEHSSLPADMAAISSRSAQTAQGAACRETRVEVHSHWGRQL